MINYFKVNLSIQIQAVHDKIRISLFGSYLSQLFMDFAPIWLIVKPVIIPIIGLVGSARTAVLRLKSSKDRALRNTSFLQSLLLLSSNGADGRQLSIHWISLRTWGMGLEQIRAISDFAL